MANLCRLLLASLFFLLFATGSTGISKAQNNLRLDLLLDAGLIYDSNFYFDPVDEIKVTTFLVQPGVELGYETSKTEWAARYQLNANYYDRAEEDDFYGHAAFLQGDIEITDRLAFELSNNFRYTRDPANLDPLGNVAVREKYYQNRAKALFSYHFEPRFTVEAGYQNWITDYKDDLLEDAVGHQGIFDLIYHLNRSASMALEYNYWDMNYSESTPDYKSNQLSLVARMKWMHAGLEAGVGYQNRSFDAAGLDDIEVVPYFLKLETESSSGKTRFALSAEHNFNYLNLSNQGYYQADRFGFTLDYDLTERITAGLGGYYQKSDYEDSPREDDTYNITGDIKYLIKQWLVFHVAAGYETRNSTIPSQEYDNWMALGQLQFIYSID